MSAAADIEQALAKLQLAAQVIEDTKNALTTHDGLCLALERIEDLIVDAQLLLGE